MQVLFLLVVNWKTFQNCMAWTHFF